MCIPSTLLPTPCHSICGRPKVFLQPIDCGMAGLPSRTFSTQTQANLHKRPRPGPGSLSVGIAPDSCFLLSNYTQLLFLGEGILPL